MAYCERDVSCTCHNAATFYFDNVFRLHFLLNWYIQLIIINSQFAWKEIPGWSSMKPTWELNLHDNVTATVSSSLHRPDVNSCIHDSCFCCMPDIATEWTPLAERLEGGRIYTW